MYTFYLDRTQVEEPESFNGISFEKLREDKYFGFILTQKGVVKGGGQIKFSEDKAFRLLKQAKEKDGYGAVVKITIYYETFLAYEGTINFWNAEWYSESVVVTYTDQQPQVLFKNNAKNRYQLSPNKFQVLGSTGIIGQTTHKILETLTTFKQETQSATNYSHVIPFQSVSGSSSGNVSPITGFNDILPVYTNDSEKKLVSVKASIFVTVESTPNTSFNVQVNDLVVNSFLVNVTPTEKILVIDEQITLEPYQTIIIKIQSLVDATKVQFVYDFEQSVLSISEIKEGIKDTNVPCISAFDLLNNLIGQATQNTMTLQSDFLKGLNLDFTNGKNLRGVNSVINASFDEVYEDLNKIYCLYIRVKDNKIIIEQRKNIKKLSSKTYLNRDNITAEVETPNVDFLYSRVKVGYKNWSLESALSNQEVNALIEYNTNIFGTDKPLDLECDCIASGILIEEIRQMQFGKITNEQQKKFDDTLVILIPNDGYNKYQGIGLNQDSRNLSIRPSQMAKNWAEVLGGYQYWNFSSGVGNYKATINNEAQSKNITTFGNILGDGFFNLQYTCELVDYNTIGEYILWTDTQGNKKEGILTQAEWGTDKEMVIQIIV